MGSQTNKSALPFKRFFPGIPVRVGLIRSRFTNPTLRIAFLPSAKQTMLPAHALALERRLPVRRSGTCGHAPRLGFDAPGSPDNAPP